MKTTFWTRKEFRQLAGTGVLFLTACVAAANAQQTNAPTGTTSQTNTAAPAKTPASSSADADTSDLNNWVELGIGGNFVSGDKAQYQRQSELPGNSVFGGVQGFHFEEPVAKKGLFTIDGRGIFDDHDYDITLKVEHPDVGYVAAGFRQYRQYYDGDGGYLPSNGAFFSLPNQQLAVDRGTAFFETGLTLPDWPVLKLRYEHDFRTGEKDSTEWGTTELTGPGGTLNAANPKNITPTYLQLDEKTDTVSADLTHTISSTDFGLGVAYSWQNINDSHITIEQPGEGANSRVLIQTEPDKTTTLSAHAFTDTRINEQWEFTTGYEYTTLHERLNDGNRQDYDPSVPATTDTRFVDLGGGEDMDQYTMNLNLMYSPTENVYIVPAFRVDKEDYSGADSDNTLSTVGGVNTVTALQNAYQDNEARLDLGESLDARYTGITNWVFYLRAGWDENHSHLNEFSGTVPLPAQILDQVWDQLLQKYTAGVNWYPLRNLNFAGSYYHQIDDNHYANAIPGQPSATYPGYMQEEDFITDGVDFRATWRPFSRLSFVSRYVFEYTTISMLGGLEGSPVVPTSTIECGKTVTHNLGETISWTPINRLFVQAGGNYVLDSTHSPAEDYSGGAILESLNNYWTVNTMIGYGIDDKTDVRAGYTYYRAGDYTDNSAVGVPFGAGGEETSVTASLGREIRRNLHATLRYAFTDYRDQLFGGNLDYKAHTIMASLKYRF